MSKICCIMTAHILYVHTCEFPHAYSNIIMMIILFTTHCVLFWFYIWKTTNTDTSLSDPWDILPPLCFPVYLYMSSTHKQCNVCRCFVNVCLIIVCVGVHMGPVLCRFMYFPWIFHMCTHGCTVRPHLSAPQISSSLTFRSSFYWSKSAIILLYTILLLPHLSSFLALSAISSRTDVCGWVRSDCIHCCQYSGWAGLKIFCKNHCISSVHNHIVCDFWHYDSRIIISEVLGF